MHSNSGLYTLHTRSGEFTIFAACSAFVDVVSNVLTFSLFVLDCLSLFFAVLVLLSSSRKKVSLIARGPFVLHMARLPRAGAVTFIQAKM